MFVERSEARVRSARTLFVLACLLPTLLLVAWAVHRASDAHRLATVAAWGRSLGLDFGCDTLVHVRPGCVRIGNLAVRAADGAVASRIDTVEIETTPSEIRVRVPTFHATPEAAALLGRLVAGWLTEPSRHDRAWLVDVGEVRWARDGLTAAPGRDLRSSDDPESDLGFRVECVASEGRRAIRFRREPATDDELKIVRWVDDGVERFEIEGRVDRAVPAACVMAAVGGPDAFDGGWVSGAMALNSAEGAWSGRVSGRVEGFDASSVGRLLGSSYPLEGRSRLDLSEARFAGSRLVDADVTFTARDGTVSQEFVDRLVQVAQCRAGEAYRAGEAGVVSIGSRPFDTFACRLWLDAKGLSIGPAPASERGIVMHRGLAVLEGPPQPIATERLAWAFAPRDAKPLPATAATAWLVPLLPAPASSPRR